MQSLIQSGQTTKSFVGLKTIGELDEFIESRNEKLTKIDGESSKKCLTSTRIKSGQEVGIYESTNDQLLKQAQSNPFKMKKLQLAVRQQLKRQQIKQQAMFGKVTVNSQDTTSFRTFVQIKKRNQKKKLNQLSQLLNLNS